MDIRCICLLQYYIVYFVCFAISPDYHVVVHASYKPLCNVCVMSLSLVSDKVAKVPRSITNTDGHIILSLFLLFFFLRNLAWEIFFPVVECILPIPICTSLHG